MQSMEAGYFGGNKTVKIVAKIDVHCNHGKYLNKVNASHCYRGKQIWTLSSSRPSWRLNEM